MFTSKKCQKPTKTKFRKNRDDTNEKNEQKKHHDKTLWRMMKQEKEDYVL